MKKKNELEITDLGVYWKKNWLDEVVQVTTLPLTALLVFSKLQSK